MIKSKCFWHGWKYDYGLHNKKAEGLLNNGFSGLKDYLNSLFTKCPDDYFKNGPRGSKLRFQLPNLDIKRHNDHEVSLLCSYGIDINAERFKSEHMKVQMFMLENDKKTIAMEIPVWFSSEETQEHKPIAGNFPLTGHIDLLRIEDNKVWVWDYKPNAQNEKYAATQTYFYALMLSKRTGIPIENFMCGWFDTANAFVFRPNAKFLAEY
ncbi:MAG: PD-(D/E)XK nuclease family protein [Candidatus Nanoarchaeia archaeon]|nr:PD-(D/E)XK nuclease family protein [Candidatus Nanoarchaeia archaeon]